jgi:raffinose/stachyose/melibiose transport system permease protein
VAGATAFTESEAASGLPLARRRLFRRTETPPGEPRRVGYLYILPALALYSAFVLAPFGHTAWISLHAWDGITPATWVGLDNYRAVLTDPQVRATFGHALVLIVFYSALPLALGLLLAASLSRMRVRGLTFFRAVLFLPQVISLVAVGVIWKWILGPEGSVNEALRGLGLESAARPWLGDFGWALPSVGLVGTWVMYGLAMVLLIAGVQKIPPSLYDAARVDGAGPLREFFAVTLPGLRNEIVVVLVLTTTTALRSFDLVYVMTQGGPGTSTEVPSYRLYNAAFQTGQAGLGAAIGIALAVIIFGLAFAITRIGERDGQ